MKSISEAIATVIRRQRGKGARTAALQVLGFTCLSFAAGLWLVPVGIAVAGVSLLVLAGLQE